METIRTMVIRKRFEGYEDTITYEDYSGSTAKELDERYDSDQYRAEVLAEPHWTKEEVIVLRRMWRW